MRESGIERREKLRREADRKLTDLHEMHMGMTPEEHQAQAEFVRKLMEKAETRAELWKEIKKGLLVWVTIVVLSGIGYLIWAGFLSYIVQAAIQLRK